MQMRITLLKKDDGIYCATDSTATADCFFQLRQWANAVELDFVEETMDGDIYSDDLHLYLISSHHNVIPAGHAVYKSGCCSIYGLAA